MSSFKQHYETSVERWFTVGSCSQASNTDVKKIELPTQSVSVWRPGSETQMSCQKGRGVALIFYCIVLHFFVFIDC